MSWKNVQYKDGKMRTSEGGGGGASNFADLNDVSFSDLQDGQVPKYNSTTEKWENANEGGGGSSSADNVSYDNTTSGMTATNVQDALDEIAQDFQDGCDIISQAVIAKGQMPASNSPQDIANAISQISGGSVLMYDIGSFFGNVQGDTVSSLSISTSGHIGNKAILVVMHRANITLNGWTLINKQTQSGGGSTQYVSLFEKIVEQSSESHTITQSSSVRMCACVFYIASDKSLSYYDGIAPQTSGKVKYYVPALSFPTLCVMSQIWTGASYISVSPDIGLNRRVSSTDTCRLMAFINQNISNTITVQNDAIDYTSDANGNRVFRYKII